MIMAHKFTVYLRKCPMFSKPYKNGQIHTDFRTKMHILQNEFGSYFNLDIPFNSCNITSNSNNAIRKEIYISSKKKKFTELMKLLSEISLVKKFTYAVLFTR